MSWNISFLAGLALGAAAGAFISIVGIAILIHFHDKEQNDIEL